MPRFLLHHHKIFHSGEIRSYNVQVQAFRTAAILSLQADHPSLPGGPGEPPAPFDLGHNLAFDAEPRSVRGRREHAGGGRIEGLYHTILGRPADPAGLANWDAQLKAGESVAQIAGQLFHSPEYLNNVVQSYYQTYLGRAGDPAGVASWVAKLQAGTSEEAGRGRVPRLARVQRQAGH